MTQNKKYIKQHKNFGTVWAVPRLCGFYPGIWLTTEEKAQKNLSQGSQRVLAGTMKIYKQTIRLYRHGFVFLSSIITFDVCIYHFRPRSKSLGSPVSTANSILWVCVCVCVCVRVRMCVIYLITLSVIQLYSVTWLVDNEQSSKYVEVVMT